MTAQNAHTPGPWYVRDFRAREMARLGWKGPSIDRILIVDKTGPEIIESSGENCVVARIQFDNRTEPLGDGNLADARLIAAAPAMLDALAEAERSLDLLAKINMQSRDDRSKRQDFASSRLDGIRVLKIIRAAIAQARGEPA